MSSHPEYDAIVIGSGMGGVPFAEIMAEVRQWRVLVLEHHFKIGGFTHTFTRPGRPKASRLSNSFLACGAIPARWVSRGSITGLFRLLTTMRCMPSGTQSSTVEQRWHIFSFPSLKNTRAQPPVRASLK